MSQSQARFDRALQPVTNFRLAAKWLPAPTQTNWRIRHRMHLLSVREESRRQDRYRQPGIQPARNAASAQFAGYRFFPEQMGRDQLRKRGASNPDERVRLNSWRREGTLGNALASLDSRVNPVAKLSQYPPRTTPIG